MRVYYLRTPALSRSTASLASARLG